MSERFGRGLVVASVFLNVALTLALFRHHWLETVRSLLGWNAPEPVPALSPRRPGRTWYLEHPVHPGATIFFGDSLTYEAPWGELSRGILNRGVPGDSTEALLARVDEIARHQPERVVLMIGINDLFRGGTPEAVAANVGQILRQLNALKPAPRVLVLSVLPIREGALRTRVKNPAIVALNRQIQIFAKDSGVRFLDVTASFADEDGQLRAELTYDGVHLLPAGYVLLAKAVNAFVQ